MFSNKPINSTKILARSEIAKVLADLRRKHRSISTRQNLTLFRLSCCCGLRVSEIIALNLSDVRVGSSRPHIRVRNGKGGKTRSVPLWWDVATLEALTVWKDERKTRGASGGDPFLCCISVGTQGKRLAIRTAQHRWTTAIGCLCSCGNPKHAIGCRVRSLSIHCGRHSFCSHSLAGGRTLAAVRDAAGHVNVATTSIYLHVVHDDDDQIGNLFDFTAKALYPT